MSNIVRFRTREEWEQEKKEKELADWEAYLAWEEETLRRKAEEREAEIGLKNIKEKELEKTT